MPDSAVNTLVTGSFAVAVASWYLAIYYQIKMNFHRQPNVSILESSWPLTILFKPDSFDPGGQVLRRRYIGTIIGFVAGVLVACLVDSLRRS